MADNSVTVSVNGRTYGGWKSVNIRSGLDTLAGGFNVGLTEKWNGQANWPIQAEDAVVVRIGDTIVLSGHVDEIARDRDAQTHTIAITGRDAVADLVDCAAMVSPGEWKGRNALAIASDIAAPFGIQVQAAAGQSLGGNFDTFTLQKGETALAAIQRLAAARGILPYSDGRGVLILGPGDGQAIDVRLDHGNLKKISTKRTRINRFRDYTVYAQGGLWDDGQANSAGTGIAHDSGIRRYRPTAATADDLADGITAADQAAWMAMVARAKAESITVTVAGWRWSGDIWWPNTLPYVYAPDADIDGRRLIASAERTLDVDGGEITNLTLVGARAFSLLAEGGQKKKGGGGGIKW